MTRVYSSAGHSAGHSGSAGLSGCVEVRRRDDEPEQFLWRDRLYLVQSVLEHWLESGGWWRAVGDGAVDDREREFWRVEAGVGRLGESGVFDLCFDWSAGTWAVVRVQD